MPQLLSRAEQVLRRGRRAATRQLRRIRARMRPPKARLVYHDDYTLPENTIADPARAHKILDYVLREGLVDPPSNIVVPRRVTLAQLLRVHDYDYLDSLDDPRVVGRILGSGLVAAEPARALIAAQRWASAGTLHAAKLALLLGCPRVVNLGGGFHHAYPASGQGFCAFNDVAIAIAELRATGFDGQILVIDLDLHHGNGTRACFSSDPSVFTLSVHAADWDESPAVANIDVALGTAVGDRTYLAALSESLPRAFAEAKPDLCFYVAGVDVAHDDQLGSWRVTADGIFARDRLVFHHIGDRPSVMVLAGGYGQDAWRHSARTIAWMLGGTGQPIASTIERGLATFRHIARTLGTSERGQDDSRDDFAITEADLFGDLIRKEPERRLLGFYTDYGVELAFERLGILEHLRARGYHHPRIVVDTKASMGESITLYGGAGSGEVLLELVVRRAVERRGDQLPPFQMLFVEWLLLQDPRAKPSPERPLLPGQDHPGLGILREVVGLLVMSAERLDADGVTFRPAHFHVAAQARGLLQFYHPEDEARFVKLRSLVGGMSLGEASEKIEAGEIVDPKTDTIIRWHPGLMVLPHSRALTEHLSSPAYDQAVEQAATHANPNRDVPGGQDEPGGR